ncbi:hypothetical protein GQ43DRAFT_21080 [Delitschia confertaspora ATCC 74209]|uniref:Uncharacterized protein n=1 Tax=Delitschia confertaspora ATCC 74209 TaxID=1513339 RepID=A0A9P4JM28_9PLEO|nr:hypothetical protein GQ43DRAFT_21080 [Delitschia confertaspora ATCC 74209]
MARRANYYLQAYYLYTSKQAASLQVSLDLTLAQNPPFKTKMITGHDVARVNGTLARTRNLIGLDAFRKVPRSRLRLPGSLQTPSKKLWTTPDRRIIPLSTLVI